MREGSFYLLDYAFILVLRLHVVSILKSERVWFNSEESQLDQFGLNPSKWVFSREQKLQTRPLHLRLSENGSISAVLGVQLKLQEITNGKAFSASARGKSFHVNQSYWNLRQNLFGISSINPAEKHREHSVQNNAFSEETDVFGVSQPNFICKDAIEKTQADLVASPFSQTKLIRVYLNRVLRENKFKVRRNSQLKTNVREQKQFSETEVKGEFDQDFMTSKEQSFRIIPSFDLIEILQADNITLSVTEDLQIGINVLKIFGKTHSTAINTIMPYLSEIHEHVVTTKNRHKEADYIDTRNVPFDLPGNTHISTIRWLLVNLRTSLSFSKLETSSAMSTTICKRIFAPFILLIAVVLALVFGVSTLIVKDRTKKYDVKSVLRTSLRTYLTVITEVWRIFLIALALLHLGNTSLASSVISNSLSRNISNLPRISTFHSSALTQFSSSFSKDTTSSTELTITSTFGSFNERSPDFWDKSANKTSPANSISKMEFTISSVTSSLVDCSTLTASYSDKSRASPLLISLSSSPSVSLGSSTPPLTAESRSLFLSLPSSAIPTTGFSPGFSTLALPSFPSSLQPTSSAWSPLASYLPSSSSSALLSASTSLASASPAAPSSLRISSQTLQLPVPSTLPSSPRLSSSLLQPLAVSSTYTPATAVPASLRLTSDVIFSSTEQMTSDGSKVNTSLATVHYTLSLGITSEIPRLSPAVSTLASSSVPHSLPPSIGPNETRAINVSVTLLNEQFHRDLLNKSSSRFMNLSRKVNNTLHALFLENLRGFRDIEDLRFSEGSVLVDFNLLINSSSNATTQDVNTVLLNGNGSNSQNLLFGKALIKERCTPGLCKNGGRCQEGADGALCSCVAGYAGPRCDQLAAPVDGNYTNWSEFTECSKTCGGGRQSRQRACTNPPPHHKGKDCSGLGPSIEYAECNEDVRCPVAPEIWIAVGVSCGVLLILLIVVIILVLRKRRKQTEHRSGSASPNVIQANGHTTIVPLEVIYQDKTISSSHNKGETNPEFIGDDEDDDNDIYKAQLLLFLKQSHLIRPDLYFNDNNSDDKASRTPSRKTSTLSCSGVKLQKDDDDENEAIDLNSIQLNNNSSFKRSLSKRTGTPPSTDL